MTTHFNATHLLKPLGLKAAWFLDNKNIKRILKPGQAVVKRGKDGYTTLANELRPMLDAWIALQNPERFPKITTYSVDKI